MIALAQAIKKKQSNRQKASVKLTVKEIDKRIEEIVEEMSSFQNRDKIKLFKALGVGEEYFTCYLCGNPQPKINFHSSTDLNCSTRVSRVCKSCLEKLALQVDDSSTKVNMPTKESLIYMLEYADQPFLEPVYQASLLEAANTASGRTKNNIYTSYKKNIAMQQYNNMRFKDSDFFSGTHSKMVSEDTLPKDQEILEQFENNKKDVKRLLGYEPFEKEKLSDQPFLYSNLVGLLDASEDTNQDMIRTSSAITIVRGFLQNAQIDDMIAKLMQDIFNAEKNVATIKALQETKQKIASTISNLAEQSCISLKHNKNATKGEDTWTGKIKKLKEMNLREAEVNAFDIGTSEGMRQVADISHASILKQIRLDENDYTEMLATQRDLIKKLQESCDKWEEKARILLRENLDLKDYIKELGINIDNMLTNDTILYEAPIENDDLLKMGVIDNE